MSTPPGILFSLFTIEKENLPRAGEQFEILIASCAGMD
jgi:hypothetical protein